MLVVRVLTGSAPANIQKQRTSKAYYPSKNPIILFLCDLDMRIVQLSATLFFATLLTGWAHKRMSCQTRS